MKKSIVYSWNFDSAPPSRPESNASSLHSSMIDNGQPRPLYRCSEPSTQDEIMFDQVFSSRKNDIKPLITRKKFESMTQEILHLHLKKSFHKVHEEEEILPNDTQRIEDKTTVLPPVQTTKQTELVAPVSADFAIRLKSLSEPVQKVLVRRGLTVLLEEARLEEYEEKITGLSSRHTDQLYSLPVREVEGYIRKHFPFFKIGHARRLALKILEERGDYKRQGIFKYSKPATMEEGQANKKGSFVEEETYVKFPTLRDWLEFLKLPNYYQNFLDAGYEDYEYLIMMMCSEHYLLNDMIIKNDVKITDADHRNKILLRLYRDREKAINANLGDMKYGEIMFGEEYHRTLANCKCTIF